MKVTVYSTPTCSFCNAAKEFLTLLGVPFNEINVAADLTAAQEMINKTGQRGVPVIDVSGTIIVGFNRQALLGTLRANGFPI
jgi:glutaredoxin-like YruB-family protein